MSVRPVVLSLLALPLIGCSFSSPTPPSESVHAIRGQLHGGQQPISGARVYLMAAGSSGYGSASISLLNAGTDGVDAIGGYVLTDTDGFFSITNDYACAPAQQVYVLALGGNPGAGENDSSGMLAAVGSCPAAGNFLAAVPYISVNEQSTVAFAYALSGFALDATHVGSSNTPLSANGMSNAFANTANLLNGPITPGANGTVPFAELNTIANILATCVNSSNLINNAGGISNCSTLLSSASEGSSVPLETATAAINIAHHPTANVSVLFALQPPAAPFAPQLSVEPQDFTVTLSFTGGGLSTSGEQSNFTLNAVHNIAVDATGNIWKPNYGNASMTELAPSGVSIQGVNGLTSSDLTSPANVAIDQYGAAWTANVDGGTVTKISSSGPTLAFGAGNFNLPVDLAVDGMNNVWVLTQTQMAELSAAGAPAPGSPFTSNSLDQPVGIAIQPNGTIWATSAQSNAVSVYTPQGDAVNGSPYTAPGLVYPFGIAIDSSGRTWVANQSTVGVLNATGIDVAGSPFAIPSGAIPVSVAIDGLGHAWITDIGNGVLLELDSNGFVLSGSVGFGLGQTTIPESVAIDGSGNVWFSSYNDATIHEMIGAAAPTVTPLSYGVKYGLLGTRP